MLAALALEVWICEGTIKDGPMRGRPCRKPLMELEVIGTGAVVIRKVCERCGARNLARFEQRVISNRDPVLD